MWNKSWSMDEIVSKFGAEHVAYIRTRPNPAIFCDCRAAGAWDANEPEDYSAYRSLAAILRAQPA